MIGKIIRALINLAIGLSGISVISSEIKKIETSEMTSATQAMVGLLPIFYAVLIIISIAGIFMGGQAVYHYYKWNAFGNRLKLAYTAKFGGENPAFNSEVDGHIKVLQALGKGYTKSQAEDWLKRMAKFVEVPWAIPDEERLSGSSGAVVGDADFLSKNTT